jgi:hypothetical protein
MKRLLSVSLAFGICCVASCNHAYAHSPYLENGEDWIGPNGKAWKIAVLRGDGILGPGPDPASSIVLNDVGLVVALGPVAHMGYDYGFPYCRDERTCFVIFGNAVLEPDPSGFRDGRKSDFYPEHEHENYGFKIAQTLFWDWLPIRLLAWAHSPILGTILIVMVARLGIRLGKWFKAQEVELQPYKLQLLSPLLALAAGWVISGQLFDELLTAIFVTFVIAVMLVKTWLAKYDEPKAKV